MRPVLAIAAVAISLGASPSPVLAQGSDPRPWSEVKCERYRQAWSQVVARRGTRGIGPEFVAGHDAFLASGCTSPANVCPRSPEEFEMANVLAIAAMNAGMADTFLPFACRK